MSDPTTRHTGRLQRRIVAAALFALLTSLAVGTVLTFELVLVNERTNLDRDLLRQRTHLETDVRARLAVTSDGDRDIVVRDAVSEFVRLESPNNAYVTSVVVDDERWTSDSTSRGTVEVVDAGEVDDAPLNRLTTGHTAVGDLRVLHVELVDGDRRVGRAIIAGPLGPARGEAFAALRRIGVAGVVGILVAIVLVWFAARRIVAPLRTLTAAAATIDRDRLGTRVEVDGDDETAVLAQEFNAMLDRLDEAAAERERLLATISHELRTPLAVVRGSIERAELHQDEPDRMLEALAVSRRELDRTARLVDDLLAMSRSGHRDFLHRRATTLAELIREFELRIDGLGFDTVTVAPAGRHTVSVDTDRLVQAVLNCVRNSIEHNPPGTTVDIVTDMVDDELVIRVSDDGIGIADELGQRVFDPFVTVRSPHGDGGTGIGLAVVATVAAAHGGTARTIAIDSGACIEIRVPAHRGGPVAERPAVP